MKIRAIIIEDEAPARTTIKSYLGFYAPEVELIKEIDSVKEGLTFLQSNSDHLIVFLDIELRDGKGIDIINNIDCSKLKIIYTTAYRDYALHAFENMAFGYLLKPINPIDFKTVLTRAITDIKHQQSSSGKLKVPIAGGNEWIEISSIIRCEAQVNYSKIVYSQSNKSVVVAKTLKQLEKELTSSQLFIRTHQSHLINCQFISDKRIINNIICLSNGDLIPVSRSRKKDVEELFESL